MLTLNQLIGFGAAAAVAVNPINFVGSSSGSYAGGTYTYASAPIATDASDVVVVGLVRESSFGSTASGLTVNGSPATLWNSGPIGLGFISAGYIEYYYCQPGALSTANIVSTATSSAAYMFVWVLKGTPAAPLDQVVSLQASTASIVLNDIAAKANGAVMAIAICEPTITGWTESWSGSEAVIEDADFQSISGNHRVVACHFATTSPSGTQDLTLTLPSSNNNIAAAIAFGTPSGWEMSASLNPTTDSAGWNGYTLRQVIDKSVLLNIGGSQTRVTLKASPSNGFVLDAAYIGHAAASGDAYDFETTPTQLLFGGSAGATVAAGGTVVSDGAAFTIAAAKNLVIALHFSGTSSVAHNAAAATGFTSYYKNASDASTVNESGYTSNTASQECVALVESFF